MVETQPVHRKGRRLHADAESLPDTWLPLATRPRMIADGPLIWSELPGARLSISRAWQLHDAGLVIIANRNSAESVTMLIRPRLEPVAPEKGMSAVEVERAVIALAIEQPHLANVGAATELASRGIRISPSRVRNIWRRRGLETTAMRLAARDNPPTPREDDNSD